jgi:hypothetical protein
MSSPGTMDKIHKSSSDLIHMSVQVYRTCSRPVCHMAAKDGGVTII